MGNQVFHFKQFSIWQDRCAMKVSTDACLLGAWMSLEPQVETVLDIGTGTGLLPLMLAQRHKHLKIDAIEIDTAAAAQAQENIKASAWSSRIQVINTDINAYSATAPLYDAIMSNPPFFNNSLHSPQEARNNARHTTQLTHNALAGICKQLLKPTGYAVILQPYIAYNNWKDITARNGMGISQTLLVSPRAGSTPTRIITICRPGYTDKNEELEMVVHNADHSYTPEFYNLLQPYYQKL